MIDKKYPENTSTVLIRLQQKKNKQLGHFYAGKNKTRLVNFSHKRTKKCVRDSAKTLLICPYVSYVRCVKRQFAKHISSLREAMKMYAKLVRGAKMKTLTTK